MSQPNTLVHPFYTDESGDEWCRTCHCEWHPGEACSTIGCVCKVTG